MEIVGKEIEEQVSFVVSIAMDRQDYEEFEETCEEQGRSMTEVLKVFMEEYTFEERKDKIALIDLMLCIWKRKCERFILEYAISFN